MLLFWWDEKQNGVIQTQKLSDTDWDDNIACFRCRLLWLVCDACVRVYHSVSRCHPLGQVMPALHPRQAVTPSNGRRTDSDAFLLRRRSCRVSNLRRPRTTRGRGGETAILRWTTSGSVL